MDFTLQFEECIYLSCGQPYAYEGVAYDGNAYYFTLSNAPCIHIYQKDFSFMASYETCRNYSAICYDSVNYCFWASDHAHPNILYCLDENLNEQSIFTIPIDKNIDITGLSCDDIHDTLFISFYEGVMEITKDGQIQNQYAPIIGTFASVLSYDEAFLTLRAHNDMQFLDFQSLDGTLLESYPIDCPYQIMNIIWDYERMKTCDMLCFLFLIIGKDGCPCFIKCCLKPCQCKPCACDLDDCNRSDSVCRLLSSIACIEAALSHILNAEGEKIQKAVEIAGNVCELLEVNESVRKTVTDVTMLEQVLFAKLNAVLEIDQCINNCEDCKN